MDALGSRHRGDRRRRRLPARPAELAAQASREQAAAERIFGLLPPDQREVWLGLWREFEAGESAESRVARAFDRVQPALLHEATDAITWRRNGTTEDQIQKRLAVVQTRMTASREGIRW